MPGKARIAVIGRPSVKDIYGDNLPCKIADSFPVDGCPVHKIGDEFIVPDDGSCPEGFCGTAFADIQRDLMHLRYGGDYPWYKEKGIHIACCTDGLRPVFFKLERIE